MMTIDADGSPSGYVAWYNHSNETSRIRALRPTTKNDRYGVQRMEMLAIYFALVDNQPQIRNMAAAPALGGRKKYCSYDAYPRHPQQHGPQRRQRQQVVVNIRSDSKSSVEQLQGISEIRDPMLQRVCTAIKGRLLACTGHAVSFAHLERTRNIAGLLLEQRRRKEEEKFLSYRYEKSLGILHAASVVPECWPGLFEHASA